MAKKAKATVQALVKTPLLTGAAARERVVRAAYDAWDKALADASRAYDLSMSGAWTRYVTALKELGEAKSGGTVFDKKYDKERETVLKVWQENTTKADKKLQAQLDASGDEEPTDET